MKERERDLLTTGQVGRMADVAAETVRRKIDAGEIEAVKTASGHRLVERAIGEKFAEERRAR